MIGAQKIEIPEEMVKNLNGVCNSDYSQRAERYNDVRVLYKLSL